MAGPNVLEKNKHFLIQLQYNRPKILSNFEKKMNEHSSILSNMKF